MLIIEETTKNGKTNWVLVDTETDRVVARCETWEDAERQHEQLTRLQVAGE